MTALEKVLCDELERSTVAYLDAKERWREHNAAYLANPTRQPDSSRHFEKRRIAAADCQWFAADVQTLAAALSALSQMGGPEVPDA